MTKQLKQHLHKYNTFLEFIDNITNFHPKIELRL